MHMNMEHRASFFSSVYQAMNSLIQFYPRTLGGGAEGKKGFPSPIYRDVKLETVRLCQPQREFLNAIAPSFYTQVHFLAEGTRYTVTSKLFSMVDSLDVMSFYIKKKEGLL